MSMTYANAETEARAHSRSEPAAFVPRYARPTKSKKAVKTWMILAPIGAVVLLGSAAAMMMRGEEGRAPVQSVETVTPETEAATAALSAVANAPARGWDVHRHAALPGHRDGRDRHPAEADISP